MKRLTTKAIQIFVIAFYLVLAAGVIYIMALPALYNSTNQTSRIEGFSDGVTYDLSFRSAPFVSTGNVVNYKDTSYMVEDWKGNLYYSNSYYGKVVKGDYVRIGDDMQVYVNGKERIPKYRPNNALQTQP